MKRVIDQLYRPRVLISLGIWILYTFAFPPLYDRMGLAAGVASTLPTVVTAWLFGTKVGLLTALLAYPINILLIGLTGQPGWASMVGQGLPGSIALVLVGGLFGWLHDLNARIKRELYERTRAEEKLQEAKQELEQQNARLAALYRVGQTINSTLETDAILLGLIDEALQVTRATRGQVLVVQEVERRFERRSQRGFSPPDDEQARAVRLPLDEGINGRAYVTRQPVCVDDVRKEPDYSALVPTTRAELAIPIIREGKVLGNLDLQSPEVGAFRDVDLDYLSALVDQVALALENARLIEGLEAQVAARTAEIRAEKEKSETILRSVADAIAMFDLHLRIRYVNPAFSATTGYASRAVIGQPLDAILAEGLSDQEHQTMDLALTTGSAWQGEVHIRRKDGRTYEAALTIAPMQDAAGQLTGYVANHQDISRRKELDRARSRFLTSVSHELRTPVTNLKLYSKLLRNGQDAEKRARYHQVLEQQTNRLANLIQDILEMTVFDSGEALAEWQPVHLSSIVEAVLTRFQNQAKTSNLTLAAKPIPEDLPQVMGDPSQLTRALAELVKNTLAFTPPGGQVTIETAATHEKEKRWLIIAVQDTGPGIPKDEQERIFDRFYRGNLVKAGHIPGTGLGLSKVWEIMRAHGGQVTVTSEGIAGQGSRFTLWLPCAAR